MMKKCIKYIIFTIMFLLIFNLNVNADICDDTSRFSKKNAGSRYCYSPSLRYNYSEVNDTWTSSHISSIYSASNTYSGRTEYPLCLDPGLYDPIGSNKKAYNYFRNLDLNLRCDKDFYKVYQYYVNDVAAAKTTLNETYYLEQANVALRVFAIQNGCDIKYLKNALNNQFHNNIYPYMIGGNSSIGGISGWGTDSQLKVLKKHYERVRDGGFLWNNPLKITPSWEYDNENNKYVFNFEIKFTNETSHYFNSNDSGLYSGDYDIGDGHAYFKYQLLINNGAYDIAGNTISGTPGMFCISTVNNIKECEEAVYILENPNSTRNIKLEMSKDTYDSIVNQTGKVTISLNYKTYHPMAEDNVVLNYIGESDMTEYKYQRMVVFSKVYKSGTINADGSLNQNTNYCSQEGNNFYYGSNQISLSEYKNKCGCSNINSSVITNSNLKSTYSNLCPRVFENHYNSTLSDCKEETEKGKNTLTHNIKSSINNYCTLTCDETVNIVNMASEFSTKAGTTFKFDTYPSLTANKKCSVDVNYDSWNNDYIALLGQEIDAYNDYVKSEAIDRPSESTVSCRCGKDCITRETLYRASYPRYYLRGSSILSETINDEWGGCSGSTQPSTKNNAKSNFLDKLNLLKNHFENLKSCNVYLNKLGTDSQQNDNVFYDFDAKLKFYYEQTISTEVNGSYKGIIIKNDNRENGVDDSSFKVASEKIDSSGNYTEYDTNINDNQYVYISSDGNVNTKYNTGKNGTNSDYVITRSVTYKNDYSPSIEKYVDTFTNVIGKTQDDKIVSKDGKTLQNPVYLGYVYDTDVAAIAKEKNNTLYEFTFIGEKTSKTTDTNSIYEKLKGNINNGVKRTCTYTITNDIIGCNDSSDSSCSNSVDNDDVNPYSNIAFRVVDPNNIDPNDRLLNSKGFKNWNNDKGKTVMSAIESSDVFNPDNLEYSFTLDSATIQSIRKYNEEKSYSNVNSERIDGVSSKLECDNGTKCESLFITALEKGNTELFNKKVALSTNGRSTWKEYTTSDGKRYIDGKLVELEVK